MYRDLHPCLHHRVSTRTIETGHGRRYGDTRKRRGTRYKDLKRYKDIRISKLKEISGDIGISGYQDIRRYQEDTGAVIPNEDKGAVSPIGATTLDTTSTTLCRRLPRPRSQSSTVKRLGRIQLIEVCLYYSKLGRAKVGQSSQGQPVTK